ARDDVRAGANRRRDVRPDLLDDAEALVAGDEEVVARGRGAVFGRVDLLVGPVDADAQHPDLHAAAVGDVADGGLGDLAQVDRVRLTWMNGDCSHAASVPERGGS